MITMTHELTSVASNLHSMQRQTTRRSMYGLKRSSTSLIGLDAIAPTKLHQNSNISSATCTIIAHRTALQSALPCTGTITVQRIDS